VEVTLTDATGNHTMNTNGDGTFCFCGVAPGSFTLTSGTQSTTGTVGTGPVSDATLTLSATCPIDNTNCSFSQGFFFRSPVGKATWTNGTVTVGGHQYTQTQGIAIFNARSGGSANTSNLFTQVAAIKLSPVTVTLGTQLYNDIQTVENFLKSLGYKLDPKSSATFPTNQQLAKIKGSAAAVTAAGNISNYIDANHCTE
jgi:hypothetical protein